MDAKLECLYNTLVDEYKQRFPISGRRHARAGSLMIDGGQHTIRLYAPHPAYIKAASGAYVYDVDEHKILDFWQGHFANILGHNPPLIAQALSQSLAEGHGLQTGMVDGMATELAELICRQTETERIRFTTSGSLSTMYATMLSRGFTSRQLVLKVGGGWHGAQPWGLMGVSYNDQGYRHAESRGLPGVVADEVLVTQFNNCEELASVFAQYGDRIACFILEPVIGASGAIPGRPEYLKLARELAYKYGALLIFDEVISGFRFRAGDVGMLYGVRPDLLTLGKIIGGGMPVAAVAGRADVMSLAGREGGRQVRFDGGTYSAHPASMLAGKLMIEYLVQHEDEVYSYLAGLGQQVRQRIEQIFAAHGVLVRCTGYPNEAIRGSSLSMIHFPTRPDISIDSPEVAADPACCLLEMREQVFKLAMLVQDVYTVHGFGALSTAHTPADLELLYAACDRVALRLSQAQVY
ncbi:MAG: aminotransferase class III-fold pyridoxal phosphate-dependent enzyme [Anaerolineae bacterium]|nr:aminotransferase class III-fold pyridoxal phosphate-dependent enzyme [Anaerolineae bacterium]